MVFINVIVDNTIIFLLLAGAYIAYKMVVFHRNLMLGTLDLTVSEYWAPFSFS